MDSRRPPGRRLFAPGRRHRHPTSEALTPSGPLSPFIPYLTRLFALPPAGKIAGEAGENHAATEELPRGVQ